MISTNSFVLRNFRFSDFIQYKLKCFTNITTKHQHRLITDCQKRWFKVCTKSEYWHMQVKLFFLTSSYNPWGHWCCWDSSSHFKALRWSGKAGQENCLLNRSRASRITVTLAAHWFANCETSFHRPYQTLVSFSLIPFQLSAAFWLYLSGKGCFDCWVEMSSHYKDCCFF